MELQHIRHIMNVHHKCPCMLQLNSKLAIATVKVVQQVQYRKYSMWKWSRGKYRTQGRAKCYY